MIAFDSHIRNRINSFGCEQSHSIFCHDSLYKLFLQGFLIPIYDYMCAYFKKIEKNIQKSTAESYRGMINGRIRRYFTARKDLTVGSITAKDIEDFYEWMFESGVVANTVIHYHTVLHSAH